MCRQCGRADGTKSVLSRCADGEYISPTQGATHRSAWVTGPYLQPKGLHSGFVSRTPTANNTTGLLDVFGCQTLTV